MTKQLKQNKKVEKSKKLNLPFTLVWPRKGEELKPTLNTTNVLLSGILVTCIILSLVSGFIDLVFFSGLSVSYYPLFGLWQIPAGILFTLMSLGFISAKFWCAMQLGAIGELQNRLKNCNYTWWKRLNKVKWKWHAAHKFLIVVSLITSISLSVISIGTGLATKAGWLETIKTYQDRGNDLIEKYDMIGNTTLQNTFTKASQGSTVEKDADKKAEEQTNKVLSVVKEWQIEYQTFKEAGLDPDDKTTLEEPYNGFNSYYDYWVKRDKEVASLLKQNDYTGATSEASLNALNYSIIKNNIRNNLITSSNVDTKRSDSAVQSLQTTKEEVKQQMISLLEELNSAKLEIPSKDKEFLTFEIGENPYVSLSTAMQQLSQLYKAWEADEGDTGASSKIFTQIASLFKSKTNAVTITIEDYDVNAENSFSNMKTEEIMIMIVIMIFGIVQEFLIALFTPKSTIDRKMLSRFDNYFGADFDIDRFLLKVYKDYLKKGILSQKEFEVKAKECVELMEDTEEDIIQRYSKKLKKAKKEESPIQEVKFEKEIEPEKEVGPEKEIVPIKEELPPKVIETPLSERIEDLKQDVKAAEEVQQALQEVKEGYSNKVDDAIIEIDNLLKGEEN